ncbi:hypothetical protein DXG03_000144 [Asterophora parasitica]|uniref:Uncharacterized protein n=1 Tax=Asterophora parasitica TaxID=117018 RepID=A0A9P7KHH2_9AGAR|nr:hypothetical protein DXG03_000144 [Asterophora parasitica]
MSVGRPNVQLTLVSEDQYRENQARIEEAQAALDNFKAMNDAAKQAYEKQQELLRKIEEGREAERQLLALENVSSSGRVLRLNKHLLLRTIIQRGSSIPPLTLCTLNPKATLELETDIYHTGSHMQDLQAPNQAFSVNQPLRCSTPAVLAFSSIAGALDLPTTNVSASVSSHSTVAPDAKQPPPSSLSVEAARLQEQIAMPKTSSTFSTAPAPVSTTVPSASAGPSNASNSDTPAPMPRPPTGSTTAKTEDLAAFLRKITSHLELMQRLQTNKFAVSAEPKPYFNLPNSTVRIYKDAMERLYVGFSDTSKANGISFVPLETLMKLKDEMKGQQQTQEHSVTPTEPAKSAPAKQVAPAKPVAPANPAASATDAQQVYTDNQGNFVFGPPTLEMSKKFKPYNVPPHPPPLRSRAPMVQEGFKAFRPYVAPPAPSTNTGPQADKTVTAATFRPTSSVSAPAAIPLPGNLPAPSISAPGMAPAPTTFSFTPVMNSVTSTPPLAAEGSPVRTPAQADKKRLAKDVLRALNLTSRKRPQPEASLAHPLEPPAKRHASGLDLQPSSSAGDEPTAASGIELPASIMPTQNSTISLASVQTPRPPGNYYRERVMKDSIDSPSTTGSDLMTVAGNQTVQRRPPGTYYKERPKPSMPPEGTSSMQVPVQTSVSPQRKPMPLPPPKRFPSRPPRPQAAVDQVHAVLSPRATPQSPPPTSRSPTPAAQSESAITPHEPHRSPSLTPPTTVFPVLKRRAKTPLFLPSPSASPFTRPTSGEADIISIDLTLDHAPSTSRKKLRRQPFYILVPPPPAYLVEYRTEQLRKHRRPSSPIVVDDGDTEVEEARSSLSTVDDEELFRTPRQLAKHHQTEHINATLKPKAALFRPELEPLPGIPGVVPSYLIEATVQQASISKERHAALGPWVLQNIAGPVNLGVKRYNAASKLTRTPSGEGVRWKANKPYDFLTYPSMNFSTTPSQPSRIRNMVDLESGEVSNLVQDGMVLWAPPPEDDSVLKIEETDEIDEQFSSPVPDQDVDECTHRGLTMAGFTDNAGPLYISSHSADVILSDIRPIKLKIEALRSINVLLDEFLYSILTTACSLSTDKLRASLLSLLPTTLGKEALLEAEVELRAYWDRTAPANVTVLEDDSKTFHLQWAFELMRLKCEAYSTLNESDEDHGAEGGINDRMIAAGGAPPKATLMAPAALYLTAILEAMCEHILSNVGRVTARDSSRASATVQDLFVALCEDHSIYDLFKTMKVYEQIEHLSKAPKVRRSKSFTRNERSSHSSSPHQDLSTFKDAPPRSRLSSEVTGIATNGGAPPVSTSGARSSFEKTRAIKMFKANSRSSFDREADASNGHKKSDSVVSENSRHTSTTLLHDDGSYENEAMQQEFDDLMRSSGTMKVSLTPDRLKTMEVYKQEKDQRGGRRQVAPISETDTPIQILPPRATGRRPSIIRVDSIKEDHEESTFKPPPEPAARNRQASVSSPSTSPLIPTRARSISTSGFNSSPRALSKLSSSQLPTPRAARLSLSNSPSMQKRRAGQGQDPFPPRTQKIQHNRESLDLEDVLGGSDDEDITIPKTPVKATTPKRNGPHVSASTRELMNFLAEGPPDSDFITDPPHNGHPDNGKLKGTGRLQRMISKLSLSNADRSRGSDETSKSKSPSSVRPNIASKPSAGHLSSLANRPIPPRPPRPISPPASPRASSDEPRSGSRSRSTSVKGRPSPSEQTELVPPVPIQREHSGSGSISSGRRQPSPQLNGYGQPQRAVVESVLPVPDPPRAVSAPANDSQPPDVVTEKPKPQSGSHAPTPASPVRKAPPVDVDTTSKPSISCSDAQDIHRLLARATTADECRLIFNMFLAKSRIPVGPSSYDVPYPSPSPSVGTRDHAPPTDAVLETGLVELFLGGEASSNAGSPPKRRVKKRSKPEALVVEALSHRNNVALNGSGRAGIGEDHQTYTPVES